MNNFIIQFEKAFSPDFCASVINKFDTDRRKFQGKTGGGVDLSKKNSSDLSISTHPEWQEEHTAIQNTIIQGLIQYARMYPHFLVGAVSTKYQDNNTGEIREINGHDIKNMPEPQLKMLIERIYELEPINMQKYETSVGGYPYPHSEHFPHPNDPTQRSLHRVLLWLVYLNDVNQGGETEFIYQNAKIIPRTGNLVFSPCGFTHTHCGHPPQSGEKYVLASWVGFKSSHDIYK